jgi:hypothetical protein
MEFKGTKGKWKIKDIKSTLETEINSSEYRIAKVKHYKGKNFNDPIEKEAKANALLISKAPEMLEMLNRFMEITRELNHPRLDHLRGSANRLIKEATEL